MSNLARKIERKHTFDTSQQQKHQKHPKVSNRISLGERSLYYATIVGVVFCAYLILSTYASVYMVNKDIHTFEAQIREQATNNEALQLQVRELSAPDRILFIATEKLGMTLDDKNVKVVQN